MTPVLVDTSFIVAVYNRSDHHHSQCVHALELLEQPTVTCEAVIAESCYLLRDVHGAAADLLATVEGRQLEIAFQLSRSAGKVQNVCEKYKDLAGSFADACLVQMADELDSGDILTLDREFRHYRWRRNRRFNLLIPLD